MEKKPKETSPPKDYAERLDPQGETGKLADAMGAVAESRLGRGFLRLLGIPSATLDKAKNAAQSYRQFINDTNRIAGALAPLGWVFHVLAHVEKYAQAATLVEQGEPERA